MSLTRDAILNAPDLPITVVEVPEWGGAVNIRSMTGTERDAFEAETITTEGKTVKTNLANLRARLVSRCIVDDNGVRLFSDADVKVLGNKSAAALQRVFDAVQKLNGLTSADVEEMAGN